MTTYQAGAGPMPKALKFAIGGLVFQALVTAFAGVLLYALAADEASHGNDDGTVGVQLIALVSIAIAVLLVVCAVLTPRRLGWVRVTVIVVESVSVLSSVIALFSGTVAAVGGIAIAAVIIRTYASSESGAFFTR
ncbi:hypothetical protein AB0K43_20985 [Kitasatospora sp. NPDC049258]|uniref:hypothetical protein n=1 Tax=Kitasatospora sp. NPDC049258 TaxID=3155394 RepID=UPI003419BD3D